MTRGLVVLVWVAACTAPGGTAPSTAEDDAGPGERLGAPIVELRTCEAGTTASVCGQYARSVAFHRTWLYVGSNGPGQDMGPSWASVTQLGRDGRAVGGFALPEDDLGLGATLAVVGDVTGNGVDDLVLGHPEPGRIAIVDPSEEEVDGRAVLRGLSTAGSGADRAAACGDLTGDGRTDLCTTSGVWQGPVEAESAPLVAWEAIAAIAAADLDGDGGVELLLGGDRGVWHLDGLGGLTGQVALDPLGHHLPAPEPVVGLAARRPEGGGRFGYVMAAASVAWVVDGDPGGTSLRPIHSGSVEALAMGDFDGDGVDDLVVGGDSVLTWYAGPLFDRPEVTTGGDVVQPDWPTGVYHGPDWPADGLGAALAVADTDGDGIDELAVTAPGVGTGRVWWLSALAPTEP